MSQPCEHAPVSSPVRGSKQGAHKSAPVHVDRGSSDACWATCGTHGERQRPSAPFSETHFGRICLPACEAREVGTHLSVAEQLPNRLMVLAGTFSDSSSERGKHTL